VVFLLAGWLIILGSYWIQNNTVVQETLQKAILEPFEEDVNSGNNLTSISRIMSSVAVMPFCELIEWGESTLSDEKFNGKYSSKPSKDMKDGIQAVYTFSSKGGSEQKWLAKSNQDADRYIEEQIDFYHEKYTKWMNKTPEERKKTDFFVIKDFVFKRDTMSVDDPVIIFIMGKSLDQPDFRAIALALDFDFFVKRLGEGLNIYAPTFLEWFFGGALLKQAGAVEIKCNDEMIFSWGNLDTLITITKDTSEARATIQVSGEDSYSDTVELKIDEKHLFAYISSIKMRYGAYSAHNGWLSGWIIEHSSRLNRGSTKISIITGLLLTIAAVLLLNIRKRNDK
jgi:hypothetical protein